MDIQLEKVKLTASGSYEDDGGDICFEDRKTVLKAEIKIFGKITIQRDAVLQPIDLQR